jgi:hypothetical protein
VCFADLGKLHLPNGGSILSPSQFFVTASAASKNEAHFESGHNGLKIIGSLTTISIRETHCM